MISIEDKIYVYLGKKDEWMLSYPKCDIVTKAYIGRNGVTENKIEGDGKTPLGEFELGITLSMHDESREHLWTQITKDMYWVDDEKSKYYNKLVDASKVEKDWSSAEHLIDHLISYEYLIEIKTNPNCLKGKGSAIFLHCTKQTPTAGCIAIPKEQMEKIINARTKDTRIVIRKD